MKRRKLNLSKQKVLRLAKEYKGTNFAQDYKNECAHSRKNNYLNELKGNLKHKLTINKIKKEK